MTFSEHSWWPSDFILTCSPLCSFWSFHHTLQRQFCISLLMTSGLMTHYDDPSFRVIIMSRKSTPILINSHLSSPTPWLFKPMSPFLASVYLPDAVGFFVDKLFLHIRLYLSARDMQLIGLHHVLYTRVKWIWRAWKNILHITQMWSSNGLQNINRYMVNLWY